MAQHGGARPGAGAPPRGVNHARRRLLTAIESGVEIAGRNRGATGDREAVITETAAHMVADMIDAGEIKEVLVLWGQVSAKAETDETGNGQKSSLSSALQQASRALAAGNTPEPSATSAAKPENTSPQPQSATHQQCGGGIKREPGQPVFIPQANLPLLVPNDAARASQAGQADQAGAPTPTPEGATPPMGVGTKNFENFSDDPDQEGG